MLNLQELLNGAHVVRSWDLVSGLVAFVGYVFELNKHFSRMGLVSLVPDGGGKGFYYH
jgi:hypothetical protein